MHGKFDLGTIRYAYRYNDDDTILSIPCDGIEVEHDDSKIVRVDRDCFFTVNDGEEFMSTLITLQECLKMLSTIDFKNEMLFYVSSW